MAGRVEFKYLVHNSLLDRIRADFRPYTEIDPFAGRSRTNEYTVRSVYYDTPRFASYEEKLAGLHERKKYRIRGYDKPDDDSIVFMEIKEKTGDVIEKRRAPLLHRNLNAFLAAPDLDTYIIPLSGTPLEKNDARRFVYHYFRYGLRPAALVVYDREAYLGKFDPSVRLTFDKNLRGSLLPTIDMLYDDHRLEPVMCQYTTLEVKFFRRTLPAWAISIISRYELPRMALSKFTLCMDMLRGFNVPSQKRILLPAALVDPAEIELQLPMEDAVLRPVSESS